MKSLMLRKVGKTRKVIIGVEKKAKRQIGMKKRRSKKHVKLFEWTRIKPDYPSLFITRDKAFHSDYYNYAIWEIVFSEDEGYNMLLDGEGYEWGALEDFVADEYMIIEKY